MLNASGSANVPRRWLNASAQSALVFSSQYPGKRPGKWSFQRSRLGSSCSGDPLVEDRVRLAAEHLDGVAEVDQRLGEVAGVDALAADVRLAPVGEVGDREWGVWRQCRSAGRVTADIGPPGYRRVVTDW